MWLTRAVISDNLDVRLVFFWGFLNPIIRLRRRERERGIGERERERERGEETEKEKKKKEEGKDIEREREREKKGQHKEVVTCILSQYDLCTLLRSCQVSVNLAQLPWLLSPLSSRILLFLKGGGLQKVGDRDRGVKSPKIRGGGENFEFSP